MGTFWSKVCFKLSLKLLVTFNYLPLELGETCASTNQILDTVQRIPAKPQEHQQTKQAEQYSVTCSMFQRPLQNCPVSHR